MQPIGKVLIQGQVNALGVEVIAAFNAVTRIDDFACIPEQSIAQGITTYIAQNRGAGRQDRIRRGFAVGLGMEAAYWMLIGGVEESIVRMVSLLCFTIVGGAVPGNDGAVLPAARHDERIPRVLPRHGQHADDFAGHADPDQPACGDDLHFGAADGNVWHCLCLRHRLVRDANGGSSILLLAKSAK